MFTKSGIMVGLGENRQSVMQVMDDMRAADIDFLTIGQYLLFIGKLKQHGWYDRVWQAYAGLIPVKTVGVKGDERSYEWATNLRAVISEDAMTAEWVDLPAQLLRETSQQILNEVSGINRVLYDISTKPPASIEWE